MIYGIQREKDAIRHPLMGASSLDREPLVALRNHRKMLKGMPLTDEVAEAIERNTAAFEALGIRRK